MVLPQIYNWSFIRADSESGMSDRAVCRKYGVARGVLNRKRAKTEGWIKPSQNLPTPRSNLAELADAACKAEANTRVRPKNKWDDTAIKAMLNEIADGASLDAACALAGIIPQTLAAWRQGNDQLDQAIKQAQAVRGRASIKAIKAAEKDDWKAAQAALRANPLYRDDWKADQTPMVVPIQINLGPLDKGVC